VDRWNILHPGEKPKKPYIAQCLDKAEGVFVAASDYVKALPYSVAKWFPKPLVALGTDGFGRSDSRAALRAFFEVDWRNVAFAALSTLVREQQLPGQVAEDAARELEIDPDKLNPLLC